MKQESLLLCLTWRLKRSPSPQTAFCRSEDQTKCLLFAEMSSLPRSEAHKEHPHLHTQTHKHTKTGRQIVPLLSHLWANSVTSPFLICHTHLRAFFCRTTWCLNRGSPSLRAMSVPQRCHKSFFLTLSLKSFFKCSLSFSYYGIHVLQKSDQKRSLKVRREEIFLGMNEDMSGVAVGWEKKNLSKVHGRKRGRKVAKEVRWMSRCSDGRG